MRTWWLNMWSSAQIACLCNWATVKSTMRNSLLNLWIWSICKAKPTSLNAVFRNTNLPILANQRRMLMNSAQTPTFDSDNSRYLSYSKRLIVCLNVRFTSLVITGFCRVTRWTKSQRSKDRANAFRTFNNEGSKCRPCLPFAQCNWCQSQKLTQSSHWEHSSSATNKYFEENCPKWRRLLLLLQTSMRPLNL